MDVEGASCFGVFVDLVGESLGSALDIPSVPVIHLKAHSQSLTMYNHLRPGCR